MNLFKKMKSNLKLVLISNLILWIIINVIGTILSLFVWPLTIVITLFASILIFTLVLKLYTPRFNRDRKRVMANVFNKTEHDELEFQYFKEEDYEAFEALNIESLAPEFDISCCIYGKYKGAKVESFSALYTNTGKKKDLVNLRIYIFEFDKDTVYTVNNHTIKHKLFSEATSGKYSYVSKNKLYIAYGYENKNLAKSFEPMSHAKYETFLERFNQEIDFIDYIVSLVSQGD